MVATRSNSNTDTATECSCSHDHDGGIFLPAALTNVEAVDEEVGSVFGESDCSDEESYEESD